MYSPIVQPYLINHGIVGDTDPCNQFQIRLSLVDLQSFWEIDPRWSLTFWLLEIKTLVFLEGMLHAVVLGSRWMFLVGIEMPRARQRQTNPFWCKTEVPFNRCSVWSKLTVCNLTLPAVSCIVRLYLEKIIHQSYDMIICTLKGPCHWKSR